MLKLMTLDMFAPHEHQTYRVDAGAEQPPVELTLIQARAKDLHTHDGRYGKTDEEARVRVDPFALLFTGPANRFLPQGTYAFTHDAMEPFSIMIVPVGLDERGYLYEAVFA